MAMASFSGSLDQASPLAASVGWIHDLLTGSVGISLATLSIAWVGFALLQGRLPVRDGVRIILGCFILFGSTIIASGFLQMANPSIAKLPVAAAPGAPSSVPLPSKPPAFDPYAGASVPNH
ncbi:TrbC/VirB2 family protein [Novosphingobium sp.]|uniref:TrbC/VirB2 family protein n=1 Tax=Novosphingobium sp. TaxID=1874826 RepID=UPI003D0EA641